MGLKLYYLDLSAPSRSTLLTINALGLENDVEIITVDVTKGEQLNPEFIKKNPLHTVPTLEDGDFNLYESHAINAYLVDKYGKVGSLYPKDLQKRAIVNQRLHFNNGILINRFVILVRPIRDGKSEFLKESIDDLLNAYDSLETMLSGNLYVAGEALTIADLSLVVSVSTINEFVPVPSDRCPNILDWLKRMQALPYYNKVNQDGLEKLVKRMNDFIAANKAAQKLLSQINQTRCVSKRPHRFQVRFKPRPPRRRRLRQFSACSI